MRPGLPTTLRGQVSVYVNKLPRHDFTSTPLPQTRSHIVEGRLLVFESSYLSYKLRNDLQPSDTAQSDPILDPGRGGPPRSRLRQGAERVEGPRQE